LYFSGFEEEKQSIPSSSELRRHFGEKLKKKGSSHIQKGSSNKGKARATSKVARVHSKGLERFRALE
jgi:hypothetical protein